MNANEREMDLDGTQCYYLNGKLHREDGPALVIPYVKKAWYLNGKLHRIDGPAEEWDWGTKYWYLNGELHREDGPAIEYSIEYADGKKRWFLNGKEYTKNKFNIVTHKNTMKNEAVTEKDKTMNKVFVFREPNKKDERHFRQRLYAFVEKDIVKIESMWGRHNCYLVVNGIEVQGSFDELVSKLGERVDIE